MEIILNFKEYIKWEIENIPDKYLLEAADSSLDPAFSASSNIIIWEDNSIMSKIKKITTAAAGVLLAVAITLSFILIRNSLSDDPNDTELDPANSDTETESFVIEDDVLVSYKGNSETVYIPEGVVEIAGKAFYQNKNIKSVIFPESVQIVGANAFRECTLLSEVSLNEGIAEIGGWAFALCENLKEIVLPETLTVIDGGAFAGTGI